MYLVNLNAGESLRLGPDVTLTVVSAAPGLARLGVDAPRSLPVHRAEVYEKIRALAAAAVRSALARRRAQAPPPTP